MPAKWCDYYELLGLYDPSADIGIGSDVTPSRLKKVWEHERRLWHPDNFSPGSRDWNIANDKFKLIDEAYRNLSDSISKIKYDKLWQEKRIQRSQEKHHRDWRGAPPKSTKPPPMRKVIDIMWEPPAAANDDFFYDLTPQGRKEATLVIKHKFPTGQPFSVKLRGLLPVWLKVTPTVFVPPARLEVEIDMAEFDGDLEQGWAGEFELDFILDEDDSYLGSIKRYVRVPAAQDRREKTQRYSSQSSKMKPVSWGEAFYENFFGSSVIWWWVYGLAANFLLSIVIPKPLANLTIAIGLRSGEWLVNGCTLLGDLLCVVILLALIWWIILLLIIIFIIMAIIFLFIHFVWPYIAPFIALIISISVIDSMKEERHASYKDLGWPYYLWALASLPLSYAFFTFVLQSPDSPFTYSEIVIPDLYIFERITLLPAELENFWFVMLGGMGLILTRLGLSLRSFYKLHQVSGTEAS